MLQKFLRIGKQLARLFSVLLVLQNLRINAAQLPRVKERRPVNERHEILQCDL